MNIQTLRVVGFLEGISFLLLLFIAMPMKYIFDNPMLVKYVGMGHGVLFILFLIVLLVVCEKQKWSLKMFILGLIASILPFGPFVFDAKIKKLEPEQAEAWVKKTGFKKDFLIVVIKSAHSNECALFIMMWTSLNSVNKILVNTTLKTFLHHFFHSRTWKAKP